MCPGQSGHGNSHDGSSLIIDFWGLTRSWVGVGQEAAGGLHAWPECSVI